ncbi:MAG: class I SAM-dependent methyltransferase [Bacteriovoracaceae bacterium]|nr:class I SAM-dependent methyltransferase [Bacteriovoracaceae bacterium]
MKPQVVSLHPESLRHLAKGHPWIIKDQYTERFRAKDRFISAKGKKNEEFFLIADTAHPKIKARFWKINTTTDFNFLDELKERLKLSFSKRKDLVDSKERENIFLCFGEADLIPGLFILLLKDGLIIQSYARYWKKYQKEITPFLRSLSEQNQYGVNWIAWQERDDSKETPINPIWGKVPSELEVSEFGVKYILKLNQGYDLGLYSDMSAIRRNLEYNWENKKVLNLYSYTGAWSLYPLKRGASKVTSVDLSEKYINWLEQNVDLNNFSEHHQSIISDTLQALINLKKQNESFDFIVCDPPSFSSDGKKTTTSLKAYQLLVPLFSDLLRTKGEALCFINTHSITRKKYDETMREYCQNTELKIIKKIKLQDDCPLLDYFPEGDYLKGLILKKGS